MPEYDYSGARAEIGAESNPYDAAQKTSNLQDQITRDRYNDNILAGGSGQPSGQTFSSGAPFGGLKLPSIKMPRLVSEGGLQRLFFALFVGVGAYAGYRMGWWHYAAGFWGSPGFYRLLIAVAVSAFILLPVTRRFFLTLAVIGVVVYFAFFGPAMLNTLQRETTYYRPRIKAPPKHTKVHVRHKAPVHEVKLHFI